MPSRQTFNKEQRKWIWENGAEWVTSKKKLGELIEDDPEKVLCKTYSAGHEKHEYTTGCAFPEIDKFFFNSE